MHSEMITICRLLCNNYTLFWAYVCTLVILSGVSRMMVGVVCSHHGSPSDASRGTLLFLFHDCDGDSHVCWGGGESNDTHPGGMRKNFHAVCLPTHPLNTTRVLASHNVCGYWFTSLPHDYDTYMYTCIVDNPPNKHPWYNGQFQKSRLSFHSLQYLSNLWTVDTPQLGDYNRQFSRLQCMQTVLNEPNLVDTHWLFQQDCPTSAMLKLTTWH